MMKKLDSKRCDWVFFDLDGTLADSLPAMYQAHLDFLAGFGLKGDRREEFEELNGLNISETIQILKSRYKFVETVDQLNKLYLDPIMDSYRSDVALVPQARAVLDALVKRNIRLALVTSAPRDIGISFVNHHDLASYFDEYAFGDEVQRAKPDPEIYLLALSKTGAHPDSVVVVEDSYHGIRSARAAGLTVLAVRTNQGPKALREAGASSIIDGLGDIILHIR